ncbi:MAG: D-2-hydroxyacid dehydrogenase [Gammaproteobacteria bacterium]|nr:D-2-hydroxyacid dehydrogenase [Gammaproteobacteria bacterium]
MQNVVSHQGKSIYKPRHMMNIVFLDGKTVNPGDLSWKELESLGRFTVYPESSRSEGIERGRDADIILSNKFIIDAEVLSHWPKVKFICITATGYNNIDLATCKDRSIIVSNVSGYSQHSTAQHTIALLLELCNHCGDYNDSVQNGDWVRNGVWSYTRKPLLELAGCTLGLIGLGSIGKQVANVARALGMRVIATTRSHQSGIIDHTEMLTLEALLNLADVVSLHAPLNDESFEVINKKNLSKMKNSALLINTARGGLINEVDLRQALISKEIKGAAIDVLSSEPPQENHPLIGLDNCLVTPHIAWASGTSRKKLLSIVASNIKNWKEGTPQNIITE